MVSEGLGCHLNSADLDDSKVRLLTEELPLCGRILKDLYSSQIAHPGLVSGPRTSGNWKSP